MAVWPIESCKIKKGHVRLKIKNIYLWHFRATLLTSTSMKFLNVNFETQNTILESFDNIADKISKDINLKINNAYYRLVDFEFYSFSKALPDPHTYKNDLQLQNGKLYLHASGVDITFGDGTNHGGILLRSIIKLYDGAEQENGFMKKQYDGPQVVATELFSNLYHLDSQEKNEIALIDIDDHNQNASFYPATKVIKTKRVGLAPKPTDKDDFYRNLELRYIAILPKFKNFKQTVKGIESILGEKVIKGQISAEDAREILEYKKNFT